MNNMNSRCGLEDCEYTIGRIRGALEWALARVRLRRLEGDISPAEVTAYTQACNLLEYAPHSCPCDDHGFDCGPDCYCYQAGHEKEDK